MPEILGNQANSNLKSGVVGKLTRVAGLIRGSPGCNLHVLSHTFGYGYVQRLADRPASLRYLGKSPAFSVFTGGDRVHILYTCGDIQFRLHLRLADANGIRI